MKRFGQFTRMLAVACVLAITATPTVQAQMVLDFPTWQAEEPGISTWWKSLIAAYEKNIRTSRSTCSRFPLRSSSNR